MSDLWKKYKKGIAVAFLGIVVLLAAVGVYVRYDYQQYCREAVPILEYHGIGPADGWMKKLFVPKETFETHLQYLHDNGYKMVSVQEMTEMFAKGESTEKTIVLTFDDGYLNNYTNVLPLLKKYEATATFFVTHSKIGHYRYMTHDQIQSLIDNGMEIGSHTINHQILTDIDPQYLSWELATSRYFLKKDYNGYMVRLLSYPNGMYNSKILAAVKEYGYYWAVTGNVGTVSKKIIEQKPLELGRIYIDASNINTFKERLRYSYWVGYLKERGINIHFFKSL
ncbi:MAG: polysaccharide deacetylase family protein [Acidaminococcaceae bacterium]|nr:polysaccharide deacetylase family protein [Acidaminococcaceae bacterium]